MDETGCSTVPTKTPSVLSPTGARRVIKISSAERGINVSVACCVSATGHFIPTFFIYPRVRMQPAYLEGAPPGSVGVGHESGWMNAESFVKWLEHFITYVRPSETNPILLLMDYHSSHITLDAVNLCRKNHIVMLRFPPHTSHRMQPLDVSFYGPLKTAYSQACSDFLTSHPGQTIGLKDIAKLFGIAFARTATYNNAIKGFQATGVEPFNSQIFDENDFAPSKTTDNEQVKESADVVKKSATPATSTSSSVPGTSATQEYETMPGTSGLPPMPYAAPKERKVRKKLPSYHITSSPVKKNLEERLKEKHLKEAKQKKTQKETINTHRKTMATKRQMVAKKKLTFTKQLRKRAKEDDETSTDTSIIFQESDNNLSNEERECIICGEFGKEELWFKCSLCGEWAHAECTGFDKKEAKTKPYICDYCST